MMFFSKNSDKKVHSFEKVLLMESYIELIISFV